MPHAEIFDRVVEKFMQGAFRGEMEGLFPWFRPNVSSGLSGAIASMENTWSEYRAGLFAALGPDKREPGVEYAARHNLTHHAVTTSTKSFAFQARSSPVYCASIGSVSCSPTETEPRYASRQRSQSIVVEGPRTDAQIMANKDRLLQVFPNLWGSRLIPPASRRERSRSVPEEAACAVPLRQLAFCPERPPCPRQCRRSCHGLAAPDPQVKCR